MKQYIDFFNQQRDAICANSAPVMNAQRDHALNVVQNSALPHIGDEHYKITDIDAIMAPDYGINSNRIGIPADIAEAFRCDVPNLSTWLYFLINDSFRAGKPSGVHLPDGVIIDSLANAAINHPQLVKQYYNTIAHADNPRVALNTLLAQDGVMIYVPKGVVLERPIQIVNILNGAVPMMAIRRLLIVADEGASLKLLLCDHTQNRNVAFADNQIIEVYAATNSTIDIYDLEESTPLTKRTSMLFARQCSGSNLLVNNVTLANGITRNDVFVDLTGEHSETHLYGMAIGQDNSHIDNYTSVSHNMPRCHTREQFKYLLDDHSQGAFEGKILVLEGADKTEAYQSNNNIIASPNAKMHTKPQLEIYADDVKCSHGATIGQLDQNALFYMRTRGVSEKDARMLLMQAFMADVVDCVRLDALRDRLRLLVEKRLSGSWALCNDCGIKCHDKINAENNGK